ncbi:MAG: hypothetical protein NTX61_00165, partial [Bacteroidetes bacterium]|nr:hypothetical protein [Bacteroidota bacterium]
MIQRYLAILLFFSFTTLCFPHPANKPSFKTSSSGFIENKGQIIDQNNKPNPGVLYLLNTPGMNVQLRRGGFSYDVYSPRPCIPPPAGVGDGGRGALRSKDSARVIDYHRIDIDLVNSNPNPIIIPSDPTPDYFNYFTSGALPDGIKDVRQYAKITYKEVYPGIDLEFFTNKEHGYKYNFVIHRGGNINDIRLKIAGPQNISFNRDILKFSTSFGDVEELIPESYYIVNNSRVAIQAKFKKINHDVYGFSSAQTIPENLSLVIDPTAIRLWGTYYGGDTIDQFAFCSTDKAGNVFLYGWTTSLNNIASTGSYQGTFAGIYDCFLAKFNSAGQRQWGTYFGGTAFEQVGDGVSIVVDKRGNIYFAGNTSSTSGIASPGAHQTLYGGGMQDCFLEKFNQAGDRLWGTYYGGENSDWAGGVTTDKDGNVFLAGYTYSVTGIATTASYQPNLYNTSLDAFFVKFDSNGVRQWGTYYGGEDADFASSCTADSLGKVYIAGYTTSQSNIASPDGFQTLYGGGGEDAFLVKFTTGGQRVWATYYGGTNDDDGFGCAADSAGNVCMVGSTKSLTGIASPGCYQPAYNGGYDAYIVKFDNLGQRSWGTYYGGTTYDVGMGCAFGSENDLFVVGQTESSNFISTPDAYQTTLGGAVDGFLVKFNDTGQRLWATYYGGSGVDDFDNCTYVRDDTIYVAGDAASLTNIASPGAWQQVYGGGANDCMLVKFLDCWPIDTAGPIAGPVNVCKLSTGLNYSIPLLAHAVNYIWTLPPGFSIVAGAGTKSIIVDIGISAVSGKIWVKGLNKCGNPGDSAYQYITVIPPPVPVISGPDNTCAGTGKVYTTAFGMTNYQWSVSPGGMKTSGGTTTDNTVTVTWNVVGAQHVYVNFTDANGCEALTPTDFTVQVTSSPVVDITINASPGNVCTGTQVTFTAFPINGGGLPAYQWKVNGIGVGGNAPTYPYSPLNNDQVSCVLTSSITGCIMNNPATSDTITMVVNPILPVSVSINSSENPFCEGSSITFTAIPTNEGTTPSYQWKVNGTGVGPDNSVYSYVPNNGDVVSCVLNSGIPCPTGNPATSNMITMVENTNVAVSVSITASANPVCAGTSVAYTATPVNGGINPVYQWKVNGNDGWPPATTFTYAPANGDIVSCILNSNATCPTGNPATSNTITMTVNPNLPVSVTITASVNPVCSGIPVTFTATPINGGSSPLFQWLINGMGGSQPALTYTYTPANGDLVSCILTSNATCATGNPANSNIITMNVATSPVVTFTRCNDSITTINAQPFRLKGGIPLGGTYSGPGVTNGIFYPAIAGVGSHQITYTYTNVALCSASAIVTIVTRNALPLICGNPLTDI